MGRHTWLAGALFAGAAAYVVGHILQARSQAAGLRRRSIAGASCGNTVLVWTLLVLALAPFLIGVSIALRGFIGVEIAHADSKNSPLASKAFARGSDYSGVILLSPPRPHEFSTPVRTSSQTGVSKPHVIPFDGSYWYFKQPDTRPGVGAHIAHGDPVINQIRSTDNQPLVMEAHQELAHPLDVSCCHVLRLDVKNGDANPGEIKVELLLKSGSARATTLEKRY